MKKQAILKTAKGKVTEATKRAIAKRESEDDDSVVGSIDALRFNFTGNQVLPSRAAYRESFLLGLLSSSLPR